jgi:GNAT superfamily N-acetyltransferase
MRREEIGDVVRHFGTNAPRGTVLYSRLTEANVEAVIEQQIFDFGQMQQDFEWKLFTHDSPPDLKDRLAARGFDIGEDEAVMVLDLQNLPDRLRQVPEQDVRPITSVDQIAIMLSVQETVWGHDYTNLRNDLTAELSDYPDQIMIYAVYDGNRPVSSAWMRFTPRSQFASLWGGSTLPDYRGQGHYTALLAVRAQAALKAGLRYLTVDASHMSRPILQKLGFEHISTVYECNWTHAKSEL